MVNWNGMIQHNIGHIYIWAMFSDPGHVDAWNVQIFRFINVIKKYKIILQHLIKNVCIYLEMKSETLNFARNLFCMHLILHNLGVLSANPSNNILYIFHFQVSKKQKVTS